MKRKVPSFFVILIVFLVVFCSTFFTNFEKFLDWKQTFDDRITEQEQIDFENQLNTKTFYYYNSLNDDQKQAYIMMHSMFENFTKSRRFEVTRDELKDVFQAVLYDNSEFFWVDVNYTFVELKDSIEFSPNYRFNKATAEYMNAVLDEKLEEIIKSADSFSSDYEKELYFNDYICNVTVYNEETFGKMGDTAYNSLINGEAICEGYSRAMQLLLDRVGINNYLVIGDAKIENGTEAHMWNVVEIGGKNYHLDVTWNDTGTENGTGYLYFNLNDEIISYDHMNILPENNQCVSMEANYFVVNELYVDRFKSYNDLVIPVANELKNNDNTVEILFSDADQLSNALKAIEKNNYGFFDFVGDAVNISGKALKTDEMEYYTIDGLNYLCLIFKEG